MVTHILPLLQQIDDLLPFITVFVLEHMALVRPGHLPHENGHVVGKVRDGPGPHDLARWSEGRAGMQMSTYSRDGRTCIPSGDQQT
jgi:hypothetical protein